MRTGSVLVGWNAGGMLNAMTTETLLHDRQRRLLDAAVSHRLTRPPPVRDRAGWLLVRAGLRLVRDYPLATLAPPDTGSQPV